MTVEGVELEFTQDVAYRPNSDPIVTIDNEPRDPVPLSLSRTFDRCDVELPMELWPWILSWAMGMGY